MGGACGWAGRALLLIGLYDVATVLLLGAVLVALLHLLRWPAKSAVLPVAVVAVAAAMASRHITDAWAMYREQVRLLVEAPDFALEGMAVAGVGDASLLVDSGLQAETGYGGWAGAWLVQAKAGLVIWRSGQLQRVVPLPLWAQALVWAIETAWVTLLVWRALRHLQSEPRCAICGRLARRAVLGRLDAQGAAAVATAWQRGERPDLPAALGPCVAVVYADTCPADHTASAGLSMVSVRRRSWSGRVPGPWASLAAVDRSSGDATATGHGETTG